MTQLDLLLPFALAPQEMARDLLRELNMPSLALLLARGKTLSVQSSEEFARALPHESWLAQRFGLQASLDNTSPALATHLLPAPLQPESAAAGFWFILQPAHLHIARDHLVLTDPRHLQLSDQDSRALFATAQPLFEESGKALHYHSAGFWLLRADDWQTLHTSTPDAACGHNVDIWMPQGDAARDWRRLQNEVQMHWHGHAINDTREMRGQKPVNTIWLWGGAAVDNASAQSHAGSVFVAGDATTPFTTSATPVASAEDVLSHASEDGLVILDALISPALAGDWAEWLARFQAMEGSWFAPLLDAVQCGRLQRLSITLSHHATLVTYANNKMSLHKFWRTPSLARLSA